MNAINQLQMSYSPAEDRILLRVNTTGGDEFRFWLTRRYAALVIQALAAHRAVDPDVAAQPVPAAKEAVEAFKQETAQARGDFAQSFEGSDQFPLGESPILAQKLKYRVLEGKLVLTIEPAEGAGINVTLDNTLNFNVGKLLVSALEKADWRLDTRALMAGGESDAGQVIN